MHYFQEYKQVSFWGKGKVIYLSSHKAFLRIALIA